MTPSSNVVPPTLPAAARDDFPTWLPAMLVKELRQGLRTRGFVAVFIVFQVIMVFLMLGTVLGSLFGNPTARAMMAQTINGFFWVMLGVQMLVVTPWRARGSLQVELDSRTLDMLLLTRLTAWRIVLGKWGSLMAQAGLLFVAMLPYGIVRYFMGSVDLVKDAVASAAMLGGCALLTAGGLATSGLPRIMRIIVPIVLVVGFQVFSFARAAMGIRGVSGPAWAAGGANIWLLWLNGAILLGIFLVASVRRIAPPAENHALFARVLALLAVLPVPLLTWGFATTPNVALGQIAFAALILGLVEAVELSSMRWPMQAHWRPWARRGRLGRLVGRFGLPGWPSAFEFGLLAAAVLVVVILLPGVGDRARWAWVVVLGLSALVFPAVVLSVFARSPRSPGAVYALIFGLFTLIAAIAAVIAKSNLQLPEVLAVANVFPVAGFWITLFSDETWTATVVIGQAVVSAIILGAAWWQAQAYWRHLASIDARVRATKE